jgi:hypothetical protein
MKATLGAIAVALTVAASAAHADETFTALSSGKNSCGEFVASDTQVVYLSWAVGYISGQNSRSVGAQRQVGNGWDQASIQLWLDDYCRANPLTMFANAVDALRDDLARHEGIKS